MEQLIARVGSLETVMTGLTTQLNGFGSEVTRMLGVIDTNDQDTKTAIQTDRDRIEARMNANEFGFQQNNVTVNARIDTTDNRTTAVDNRVLIVEQEKLDSIQSRIAPAESEMLRIVGEMSNMQAQIA